MFKNKILNIWKLYRKYFTVNFFHSYQKLQVFFINIIYLKILIDFYRLILKNYDN